MIIKCLLLFFVLQRFGFTSAVECQGHNSNSISTDRFYYSNYNEYILIFEDYLAWIFLKDLASHRTSRKTNCYRKDRDRDRDKNKDKVNRNDKDSIEGIYIDSVDGNSNSNAFKVCSNEDGVVEIVAAAVFASLSLLLEIVAKLVTNLVVKLVVLVRLVTAIVAKLVARFKSGQASNLVVEQVAKLAAIVGIVLKVLKVRVDFMDMTHGGHGRLNRSP